ncbi:hypothetical protein CIHG_03736 [Coccidioides immitis H538.4]|uniref:Uncharacterized protein n=2 Tax=Coccidioides immitis TaxID=5501 RepID=A0A0J8RM59_COCIT|nr:hypothetical protein CIRG_04917 [Coccidioides immitis RMSCC 2394]KMU85696.1 hypothetical protein CIHG_03736 [Coccidioides immitis H538.4]
MCFLAASDGRNLPIDNAYRPPNQGRRRRGGRIDTPKPGVVTSPQAAPFPTGEISTTRRERRDPGLASSSRRTSLPERELDSKPQSRHQSMCKGQVSLTAPSRSHFKFPSVKAFSGAIVRPHLPLPGYSLCLNMS